MELVANPGPYTAIVVRDRDTLARLSTMELPDGLAVEVELDKETAAWLAEGALGSLRSRLTLRLGNHEYLSESRDTDPEAPALRALSLLGVPMKNVPRCLAGEQSRPADHKTLHAEMIDRNGDLDIDRYVHHYITSEYYAKSKRCRGCVFDADCKGMHINYLRNQGFKVLEPVPAASTAAATA
jgi:hypothetical protein